VTLTVIQERDGNNLPQVTYTRGTDLSGSMQGAGGIGGLLARTDATESSVLKHGLYHADGNGNVTCLVSTNQLVLARYQYDPYGDTLAASGPLAHANVYRFSSMELHAASELVQYLYRHYGPSFQRWLTRDPVGEAGFKQAQVFSPRSNPVSNGRQTRRGNDFLFVCNRPVQSCDPGGLSPLDVSAILGSAISRFFRLCDQCLRCDNSGLVNNNAQIVLFGTPYFGCGDQAEFIHSGLQPILNDSTDALWKSSVPHVFNPLPHFFLELTSNDPADPTIRIDPYRGIISLRHPPAVGETSQKIEQIVLKCKPRTATYRSFSITPGVGAPESVYPSTIFQ
jgi:RHS repeat-associated protein